MFSPLIKSDAVLASRLAAMPYRQHLSKGDTKQLAVTVVPPRPLSRLARGLWISRWGSCRKGERLLQESGQLDLFVLVAPESVATTKWNYISHNAWRFSDSQWGPWNTSAVFASKSSGEMPINTRQRPKKKRWKMTSGLLDRIHLSYLLC